MASKIKNLFIKATNTPAKKIAWLLGASAAAIGGVAGYNSWKKREDEKAFQESVDDFFSSYGFDSPEDASTYLNGYFSGKGWTDDFGKLESSVIDAVKAEKLAEINADLEANGKPKFDSLEAWYQMATANATTYDVTREQYANGVERFGLIGYEQRKQMQLDEIATEHGFVNPDGQPDSAALLDFVNNYGDRPLEYAINASELTPEQLELRNNIILAKNIRSETDIVEREYQIAIENANELFQDVPEGGKVGVTCYETQYANDIMDVDAIDLLAGTDASLVKHLDVLQATSENSNEAVDQFVHDLIINAYYQFGDRYDEVLGIDLPETNVDSKDDAPVVDGADNGQTPPAQDYADAATTPADQPNVTNFKVDDYYAESVSNQDILDAQNRANGIDLAGANAPENDLSVMTDVCAQTVPEMRYFSSSVVDAPIDEQDNHMTLSDAANAFIDVATSHSAEITDTMSKIGAVAATVAGTVTAVALTATKFVPFVRTKMLERDIKRAQERNRVAEIVDSAMTNQDIANMVQDFNARSQKTLEDVRRHEEEIPFVDAIMNKVLDKSKSVAKAVSSKIAKKSSTKDETQDISAPTTRSL